MRDYTDKHAQHSHDVTSPSREYHVYRFEVVNIVLVQ